MRAVVPRQFPGPARAAGFIVTGTAAGAVKPLLVGVGAALALLLIGDVALYRVLRSQIPQSPARSPGHADLP